MTRVAYVIERQIGYELAFAVEAGKFDANAGAAASRIAMGFIDLNLSAQIGPASLETAPRGFRARIRMAMLETLVLAETSPDDVASVILVGGSSLMSMIAAEARTICPRAQLHRSNAFTAVVEGLALATVLAGEK